MTINVVEEVRRDVKKNEKRDDKATVADGEKTSRRDRKRSTLLRTRGETTLEKPNVLEKLLNDRRDARGSVLVIKSPISGRALSDSQPGTPARSSMKGNINRYSGPPLYEPLGLRTNRFTN